MIISDLKSKNKVLDQFKHKVIVTNKSLGIDLDYLSNLILPMQYESTDNIIAEDKDVYGRNIVIQEKAYQAFKQMQKAAAIESNLDLQILSAFRSVEYQKNLIINKLKKDLKLKDILAVLAPPGFSEHHTGRALDLTTSKLKTLTSEFDQTEEFLWLENNADKFNFVLSYPKNNAYGMIYEPWHWCFVA